MSKQFIAFQDTRVATKLGHVLYFKAGKPREVPKEAVRDVLAAGVTEFNAERAKQMAEAARLAAEALENSDFTAPDAAPAEEADPVRSAVAQLIAENDAGKLTKDRVPRLTEVRKLLPKGVTTDAVQVYDLFLQITDSNTLADEDGISEKDVSDAALLAAE